MPHRVVHNLKPAAAGRRCRCRCRCCRGVAAGSSFPACGCLGGLPLLLQRRRRWRRRHCLLPVGTPAACPWCIRCTPRPHLSSSLLWLLQLLPLLPPPGRPGRLPACPRTAGAASREGCRHAAAAAPAATLAPQPRAAAAAARLPRRAGLPQPQPAGQAPTREAPAPAGRQGQQGIPSQRPPPGAPVLLHSWLAMSSDQSGGTPAICVSPTLLKPPPARCANGRRAAACSKLCCSCRWLLASALITPWTAARPASQRRGGKSTSRKTDGTCAACLH